MNPFEELEFLVVMKLELAALHASSHLVSSYELHEGNARSRDTLERQPRGSVR